MTKIDMSNSECVVYCNYIVNSFKLTLFELVDALNNNDISVIYGLSSRVYMLLPQVADAMCVMDESSESYKDALTIMDNYEDLFCEISKMMMQNKVR